MSSIAERLLRDVHGAQFHPLPEKRQHLFTGKLALGQDPIGVETVPKMALAAG
jgi:hypothetical protein